MNRNSRTDLDAEKKAQRLRAAWGRRVGLSTGKKGDRMTESERGVPDSHRERAAVTSRACRESIHAPDGPYAPNDLLLTERPARVRARPTRQQRRWQSIAHETRKPGGRNPAGGMGAGGDEVSVTGVDGRWSSRRARSGRQVGAGGGSCVRLAAEVSARCHGTSAVPRRESSWALAKATAGGSPNSSAPCRAWGKQGGPGRAPQGPSWQVPARPCRG